MRLPNVSKSVMRLSQPLVFITEVITTKDFRPHHEVSRRAVSGVINSLSDEAVSKDSLDWSLEYFTVHVLPLDAEPLGVFMQYRDKLFKSVNRKDYSDYGYVRYVFEEVKDAGITARLIAGNRP